MAQRPMQQQGLPHPQYRLGDPQQPMRIFINQQSGQQNAIHGVVPGGGGGLQMVSPISTGQMVRQPGGQIIQTSNPGSFAAHAVVQQGALPQGATFQSQATGMPVQFIHRPTQQITVVSSQPQPVPPGSVSVSIQPRPPPPPSAQPPGITAQTLITAHGGQPSLANIPHGTVNIIRHQPLTIRPAIPSPASSGHTAPSQGPPSSGRASSLSGAGPSSGNPALTAALQPGPTPSPSFGVNDSSGGGRNGELLTKQRLDELVQEVDPHEQLDDDVKDVLVQLTDDFIEQVVSSAARLAKHRQAKTIDVKDVQMVLERNYNMWIPGFGSDQMRPYKKASVTDAHKQRLALIKKTMKKL